MRERFRDRYPDLMERYLPRAKGALFYGLPVDEFDRDELLVAVAMGWSQNRPPVHHVRTPRG